MIDKPALLIRICGDMMAYLRKDNMFAWSVCACALRVTSPADIPGDEAGDDAQLWGKTCCREELGGKQTLKW